MNSLACRLFVSVGLLSLAIQGVSAQGTKADYDRMARLGRLTSNKVFRINVTPNWLHGGHHLWYRVQTGPSTHEFVLADLKNGTRNPAFDHDKVAKQLSKLTGEQHRSADLQLTALRFSTDLKTLFFRAKKKAWQLNRTDSVLFEIDEEKLPQVKSSNLTSLRPSVDKGGEMELEFFNDSEGTLRTIWIDRSGKRVPYQTIAKGKRVRQHTFAGHIWLVVNEEHEAVALFEASIGSTKIRIDGQNKLKLQPERRERPRPSRSGATSPDRKFRAVAKGGQLSVRNTQNDEEVSLSQLKNEFHHFTDNRFYWSPDSRYLVAMEVEPAEQRKIFMVESSPRNQLQPKLHQMTYVKPGDSRRTERPRMFDMVNEKEIELDASLMKNPWSLGQFRWRADSTEFSFLFNQRGHQVMRMIGIRPESGSVRAIVDEQAKTFVDYTNKVYTRYLEDQDEIVWMSERDGWNHLYLYDWRKGKVKNQITKGPWVVRGVDRVDEVKRQIWFRASGMVIGQDPYYIHHCRIDFDGSNLVTLTAGNGTHSIQYSPNKEYLIDTYSRVDQPTITNVRRVSDGSLACQLETGDWNALLATDWKASIPFSAKGRDSKTDIFGVIHLPTNFDENKKYPVIEYIYAGPHGSFVPKRFLIQNQARSMAELGFIVVQIDGMGTNNRSKAFHDVCWKNLGDSGFPDRILWMKAAARKYPQMDLSRVGIYGGSAGGQSALRAVLAHGDFYKAAVADCGCHDNRMDKIWWNEQWMGWPIGPHYKEQSNVTNAHKLKGKLFLIVGELDRNVDPASTMQVVNALVKANKDFDLLVVPGGGHGVGSSPYGMRRTRDFFVRHLHGAEPRRE